MKDLPVGVQVDLEESYKREARVVSDNKTMQWILIGVTCVIAAFQKEYLPIWLGGLGICLLYNLACQLDHASCSQARREALLRGILEELRKR